MSQTAPETCGHPWELLTKNVVHTEYKDGKMHIVACVSCKCGACWTGDAYNAVRTQ